MFRILCKQNAFTVLRRTLATKVVESDAHFQKVLNMHSKVVLSFGAQWCKNCKTMEQDKKSLAERHPDLLFLSIDVTTSPDTAAKCGVTVVPTFLMFEDGALKYTVKGANVPELSCKLDQFTS